MIKIDEIKINNRATKHNTENVAMLAESIKEIGLINPITLDKENTLIAGYHRIQAYKMLGYEEIEYTTMNIEGLQAEMAEIDENIARQKLPDGVLDNQTLRRKEIYEELYPETKHGMRNGQTSKKTESDSLGKVLNAESALSKKLSFVKDISEKTGKSETVIKERLFRAKNTLPEVIEKLDELEVTKTDRNKIARMKPEEQIKIVDTIISGKAENFNEACKEIKEINKKIEKEKKIEQIKEIGKNKEIDSKITLLEGDLFDIADNIPNDSIDLLNTDPPYFILDEKWDTFDNKEKFLEFTEKWLKVIIPKVKDTGRIYISISQWYQYDFYNILAKNDFFGFTFKQNIIWYYKNNNQPSNRKEYRYMFEPIFYLYGENAEVLNFTPDTYGETQQNVWEIATPQSNFKEGKYHAAQKPLELYRRIIKTGCKENDTVLDCFAGSGTTGVICNELNRKCILIERDLENIKIIKGRV